MKEVEENLEGLTKSELIKKVKEFKSQLMMYVRFQKR